MSERPRPTDGELVQQLREEVRQYKLKLESLVFDLSREIKHTDSLGDCAHTHIIFGRSDTIDIEHHAARIIILRRMLGLR